MKMVDVQKRSNCCVPEVSKMTKFDVSNNKFPVLPEKEKPCSIGRNM